jgi:branched-chain amino acid transport system substrate-binding protein
VLTDLDQLGWYPHIVTVPDAARPAVQAAISPRLRDDMVAGPIANTFITPNGTKPTGMAGTMLDQYLKLTGDKLGTLDDSITTVAIGWDLVLMVNFGIVQSNGGTTAADIRQGLESGKALDAAGGPSSWGADKRQGLVEDGEGLFVPSKSCGQGSCVAAPAPGASS